MLVKTERGLLSVLAIFENSKEAIKCDFSYAFTDSKYGDLYSKLFEGNCRAFAVVSKNGDFPILLDKALE